MAAAVVTGMDRFADAYDPHLAAAWQNQTVTDRPIKAEGGSFTMVDRLLVSVLGAGVHGREVASVIFDGAATLFDDYRDGLFPVGDAPGPYVVGAAMPRVRAAIAAKANCEPWRGTGNVVFPGAQLSPSATLGDHVHLGYNAVVQHGCYLGSFVQVCAGAVLSGEVTLGDGVFVGANATIIHGGITVGAWATIGAGAVVTADVPPGATVVGVPARPVRQWLER